MAEKPGYFVRNQLEPWATVAKPWVTDRRDLVSSLVLSSIGGASSSEKFGRRQKSLLMRSDPMRAPQLILSYLSNPPRCGALTVRAPLPARLPLRRCRSLLRRRWLIRAWRCLLRLAKASLYEEILLVHLNKKGF